MSRNFLTKIKFIFAANQSISNADKNKLDHKERAIQSASSWNSTFNRARIDGRKCYFDLQNFSIQFPVGPKRPQELCRSFLDLQNGIGTQFPPARVKPLFDALSKKSNMGEYPIALIPGQFTDFYKRYIVKKNIFLCTVSNNISWNKF